MKQIDVYALSEIKDVLLKNISMDLEPNIADALFEWSCYERFIHVNVDKLEEISTEYYEDGIHSTNDGHVPNRIQKWIKIVDELILLIEKGHLPEEFMIDYESDLSVYK